MGNFDYKTWYEKNKKRLSAERKKKYREDREHREKTRRRSRRYWREKKAVTVPADRTLIRSPSGEYFTIGRLARMINRQPSTVRDYHAQGVIPQPDYYDSRGWRLYTRGQAMLVQRVFRRFDDGDLQSLAEVSRILEEEWTDA